jgi:hypothetical protein
MVTATSCPICRKAVYYEDDPTVVVARMRGVSEDAPVVYFHVECYPGDAGSGFERIDRGQDSDG